QPPRPCLATDSDACIFHITALYLFHDTAISMVQGVHKLVDERLKQIRELTLMLMYLTSWEDHDAPGLRAVKKKELGSYPLVRRCWKGYDFRLLKDLVEEGLICD